MSQRTAYKTLRTDTKRLLSDLENREVDFKVKPNGVKAEDFVAFANTRGGTILVGVDEKKDKTGKQIGVVVGCSIDDSTRQGFISSAASCRPSIDIQVTIENIGTDKPIFRIDIPEGAEKPYCTSQGVYKYRAEGQRVGIDPTMMTAIILEREADEFVTRFQAAGEALLKRMSEVQSELTKQIQRVEEIAAMAHKCF